jgi:hypothetical protein
MLVSETADIGQWAELVTAAAGAASKAYESRARKKALRLERRLQDSEPTAPQPPPPLPPLPSPSSPPGIPWVTIAIAGGILVLGTLAVVLLLRK